MSIEIYDKATIVKKGDKYYYLLKYGSKNCFTCPFQSVMDNNFHPKYLRRQARDSDWSVKAIGTEQDFKADKIADTYFNSPTSVMYGKIRFGNGKNIAQYYVGLRHKGHYRLYDRMDDVQKANIDRLIAYAEGGEGSKWVINLSDIQDKDKFEKEVDYCGNKFVFACNAIPFKGRYYWALDNL